MVLMVFVSVIVAGLFTMAFVGTTSLKTYKEERSMRYGIDGVLQYGIARAVKSPTIGVGSSDLCSGWLIAAEGMYPGDTNSAFASGSYFRLRCRAYVDSSGPDSDGGQKARFVRFDVYCATYRPGQKSYGNNDQKPYCNPNGSGPEVTLGTAKVRFDKDPNAAQASQRAVIPKVITWDLLPQR